MSRDDELPEFVQATFLAAYAQAGGNITAACRVAGISRTSHYRWLKDDASYAERFQAAHEEACDAVEEEIKRRGQDGYDQPVVYHGDISRDEQGQPVVVRKYSDRLLMFRARALMPERYGERTRNEADDSPPRVVVIEDEGWYGNDAHQRQAARDQAAQDADPPGADSALPGPL
ncbi:MAG TPA: hypothetical protein VG125_08415 [Pirellulales bacterium]|jgi:hypothetical protein|nr:hypothetical protein [Pirellulales bacterium]